MQLVYIQLSKYIWLSKYGHFCKAGEKVGDACDCLDDMSNCPNHPERERILQGLREQKPRTYTNEEGNIVTVMGSREYGT